MKKRVTRRGFLGSSLAAASLFGGAGYADAKERMGSPVQPETVRNHPLEGIARENVKITDVRVRLFSCKVPIEKWWYGCGVTILTELTTNRGITGIGGPSPYGGLEFVKEYTERFIRPAILGKNPFDLEVIAPGDTRLWESAAWAGVNIACWDIIGKLKEKPVYELLATNTKPERRILHYASAGTLHNWRNRPEDLYDEALRYKEEGFTAFKFRLGEEFEQVMTIKKYIPFLVKLREAVGWDFDLIHENNMRLNLDQCLELAPALEELKFWWLEEPVNRWGRDQGMRDAKYDIAQAIREHVRIGQAMPSVLVSGGETMTTRYEFKDWIEQDAYDIVQPDCNTTGLSEGWYIAQHAHLHGKTCTPHNWHAGFTWMSNIQLAAAIPNRLVLEACRHYNPLGDEIFKDPIVVKNGYAEVPDRPGLGVEVIEDADQRFPYDPNNHWMKLRKP